MYIDDSGINLHVWRGDGKSSKTESKFTHYTAELQVPIEKDFIKFNVIVDQEGKQPDQIVITYLTQGGNWLIG